MRSHNSNYCAERMESHMLTARTKSEVKDISLALRIGVFGVVVKSIFFLTKSGQPPWREPVGLTIDRSCPRVVG